MKDYLYFLVLLGLRGSFAQSTDCFNTNGSATPANTDFHGLLTGQQSFGLQMLKIVNAASPTENTFFSPYSIYNALLLAYFTSANHTEASLKKTLAIPESQDKLGTMLAYNYEKHIQGLTSSSYQLSSANRLYVSKEHTVRPCMKDLFNDELVETDFRADPKAAQAQINSWVESVTKNQIKNLLKDGDVTHDTQLVLANAAYFKGVWKARFNPEMTHKEVFYSSPNQGRMIQMMRMKSSFNHLASDKIGAHVLELPYKGDTVSLFILLPPFASGVNYLLNRLTLENFREIVADEMLIARPVEVSIPRFTVEQEMDLTPVLETMGVGDLFKSTSDLSYLTGKPGLGIDSATHKAKISLDEEGTTAAAATALFNFRSSRPLDPIRFTCNHPFVYILFDKPAKSILFAGVFNKPPTAA